MRVSLCVYVDLQLVYFIACHPLDRRAGAPVIDAVDVENCASKHVTVKETSMEPCDLWGDDGW